MFFVHQPSRHASFLLFEQHEYPSTLVCVIVIPNVLCWLPPSLVTHFQLLHVRLARTLYNMIYMVYDLCSF